jgi:uncharacterized protein YndB with AHSA1/START domain
MAKPIKVVKSLGGRRRRVKIVRTFKAPIADVWRLWTTKKGIESWWGPEGFAVKVRKIDLRPGGKLQYAMTATAPAQVEFMRQAGMPLTTAQRLSFADVVAQKRLSYTTVADFIPDVEPYEVSTTIDLRETARGVQVSVSLDAMHDKLWTQRAVMGHQSELDNLGEVLAGREVKHDGE